MTEEGPEWWGVREGAVPETAVSRAFVEAAQRKADDEARRLAAEQELAAATAELHRYDPWDDDPPRHNVEPHDTRMYEGTGIGALYGLPGSECFLPELGGWKIVPRSTH